MTGDIGDSMIVRFEGKSRVKGNTDSPYTSDESLRKVKTGVVADDAINVDK